MIALDLALLAPLGLAATAVVARRKTGFIPVMALLLGAIAVLISSLIVLTRPVIGVDGWMGWLWPAWLWPTWLATVAFVVVVTTRRQAPIVATAAPRVNALVAIGVAATLAIGLLVGAGRPEGRSIPSDCVQGYSTEMPDGLKKWPVTQGPYRVTGTRAYRTNDGASHCELYVTTSGESLRIHELTADPGLSGTTYCRPFKLALCADAALLVTAEESSFSFPEPSDRFGRVRAVRITPEGLERVSPTPPGLKLRPTNLIVLASVGLIAAIFGLARDRWRPRGILRSGGVETSVYRTAADAPISSRPGIRMIPLHTVVTLLLSLPLFVFLLLRLAT